MDNRYYEPIECGSFLPLDNPHAFSVSIPTYQDVVDYEEESNDIFERIRSAYPRIVFHPYVKAAAEQIRDIFGFSQLGTCFVLPSQKCAEEVAKLSGTSPSIRQYEGLGFAYFPLKTEDNTADFYAFMKHCGYMIYSREAEDFLLKRGIELPQWEEEYCHENPDQVIRDVLTQGYGESEITLCGSGMNGIYAAYAAIKETAPAERTIFIQYGWLYTDSIHILRKSSDSFHQIGRVCDFDELKDFLAENGSRVAAVFTETISNPLLQTPDLPALAELAKEYGFSIVLDNTFATPWNVNVAPYADIIVESLTKFASGRGDCMSGAVIIPENSSISEETVQALDNYTTPLKGRDLKRLAATIGGYRERVKQVNHNSAVVVDYLIHNEKIQVVHHVYSDASCDSYRKIAVDDSCYGGVISFVVKGDFPQFYDNLDLPKGPSLGCNFPLAMSYTLLAHWDLVNEKDQKTLNHIGLSPWLIRLSVGEDNPRKIIDAIERALAKMQD